LAKTAETKVNAEEKKQWNFQMKQYNDEVSLEKQRINAIKDIAASYYKSQTSDVDYTLIVK
jgi:fructose-1,6-bisphosphatase